MTRHILDRLLNSDEPSVQFKVQVHVLGRDPHSLALAVRKAKGHLK
jgi:hypothetical protein